MLNCSPQALGKLQRESSPDTRLEVPGSVREECTGGGGVWRVLGGVACSGGVYWGGVVGGGGV